MASRFIQLSQFLACDEYTTPQIQPSKCCSLDVWFTAECVAARPLRAKCCEMGDNSQHFASLRESEVPELVSDIRQAAQIVACPMTRRHYWVRLVQCIRGMCHLLTF